MQFVHPYEAQYYSEVSQSRPCKFAYARKKKDGTVEVLHTPVKCRDFLNDTLVWKAKEYPKTSVYGYNFCGKIDTKSTTLYLVDTDNQSPLKENIAFVNKLEEEIGLPPTKVTTNDNKEFLIQADKWWMTTTVHLSFFTYLLRQLTTPGIVSSWKDFKHDVEFSSISDKLTTLHRALTKLNITHVSGTKNEYLLSHDMETIHDYNGFRSQLKMSKFTEYGQQLNELIAP